MKIKSYLALLISGLFIFPFNAFADSSNSVFFQNLTDSRLTVQYKLCKTYPYPECTQTLKTKPIDKYSHAEIDKGQTTWTYLVVIQANTDDNWQYIGPQTSASCNSVQFYDDVPNFTDFTKTTVNPWMECQVAPGSKKSK